MSGEMKMNVKSMVDSARDTLMKNVRELALGATITFGSIVGASVAEACVSIGPSRFTIDGQQFTVQFPRGENGGIGEVKEGNKGYSFDMNKGGKITMRDPSGKTRTFQAYSITRGMGKVECGDLNLKEESK